MRESFLSRAKADGKVFIKTVGLMARLGKLRLAIRQKRQEKERLLRKVGTSVVDILLEEETPEGSVFIDACGDDLAKAETLDTEVSQLEEQMEQARREFRGEKITIEEQPKQP